MSKCLAQPLVKGYITGGKKQKFTQGRIFQKCFLPLDANAKCSCLTISCLTVRPSVCDVEVL